MCAMQQGMFMVKESFIPEPMLLCLSTLKVPVSLYQPFYSYETRLFQKNQATGRVAANEWPFLSPL